MIIQKIQVSWLHITSNNPKQYQVVAIFCISYQSESYLTTEIIKLHFFFFAALFCNFLVMVVRSLGLKLEVPAQRTKFFLYDLKAIRKMSYFCDRGSQLHFQCHLEVSFLIYPEVGASQLIPGDQRWWKSYLFFFFFCLFYKKMLKWHTKVTRHLKMHNY